MSTIFRIWLLKGDNFRDWKPSLSCFSHRRFGQRLAAKYVTNRFQNIWWHRSPTHSVVPASLLGWHVPYGSNQALGTECENIKTGFLSVAMTHVNISARTKVWASRAGFRSLIIAEIIGTRSHALGKYATSLGTIIHNTLYTRATVRRWSLHVFNSLVPGKYGRNSKLNSTDWWPRYFLWKWLQMYVTEPYWW